jgi:hypothetical protein
MLAIFALGIAYRRIGAGELATHWGVGISGSGSGIGWPDGVYYKVEVMIPQVDYRGAVKRFRRFTELFPQEAVVLFNDDEPVGAAGVFGTPHILCGKAALAVRMLRMLRRNCGGKN